MEPEQTSTTNNGKSLNPMLIVLVLVVVGAAIFGYNSLTRSRNMKVAPFEENGQTDSIPVEESENTIEGDEDLIIDQSEIQIIEVEAGSFYYKPNEIRVKLGDTVKIVMTSVDMMHNFNIDELGVTIPITKKGETSEVEFTPDKAGEFEFYCSVGQHRKMGQVGKLIVE